MYNLVRIKGKRNTYKLTCDKSSLVQDFILRRSTRPTAWVTEDGKPTYVWILRVGSYQRAINNTLISRSVGYTFEHMAKEFKTDYSTLMSIESWNVQ